MVTRWGPRYLLSTAAYPRLTVRRLFVTYVADHERYQQQQYGSAQIHRERKYKRNYALRDRIDLPARNRDAWTALLDGALPLHLRNWQIEPSPPTLSAVDVAELLLAAQYPQNTGDEPMDLLYHLGVVQNRWNAVVWLVKKLAEKFPARHTRSSPLSDVNYLWKNVSFSKEGLNKPLELSFDDSMQPNGAVQKHSLNDLTHRAGENFTAKENLQHDALGQVWRTLGAMTQECVGGDIRPEVLEIIAFLHHQEIMPISIYNSEPHPDSSAIQSPPLLSMFSSRILTSLSDAAWRAHEKIVVEEAKAGGKYAALRPEIPGSAYRVHVAGLKPEVWMELILWSCIRGGWVLQGAEILRSIVTDKQWRPISWRNVAKTMPNGFGWDELEHELKTRASSTLNVPEAHPVKVERTISAEVINAYIDALAGEPSIGVDEDSAQVTDMLLRLHELKRFLRQQKPPLALSTGSWDALVLRLVENGWMVPEKDSNGTKTLVKLSVGFRQPIRSTNNRDLPDYTLDGNMAMHGLLHRALYGQIVAGSFEGAFEIFRYLSFRSDSARSESLNDFMSSLKRSLTSGGIIASDLAGIEYPGFDSQIPAPILGSFLELAMDAQEYDFARWLLYSDDLVGPIITERRYGEPHIQPAVVRLAVETDDERLLAQFTNNHMLRRTLKGLFDAQVNAMRWDTATRVIRHLDHGEQNSHWAPSSLANLARVMLLQTPGADSGDQQSKENLERSEKLFHDMISHHSHHAETVAQQNSHGRLHSLLSVISAINHTWARSCAPYLSSARYENFDISTRHFNLVLQGTVGAYGSAAGRRLLSIFEPHGAGDTRAAGSRPHSNESSAKGTTRDRPLMLRNNRPQRIVLSVPVPDCNVQKEIVLYGAVVPNTQTILVIMRKALEELQANGPNDANTAVDFSPETMVRWAVKYLANLPNLDGTVVERLDDELRKMGMHKLRAQLPKIVRSVEADAIQEPEESYLDMTPPDQGDELKISSPSSKLEGKSDDADL